MITRFFSISLLTLSCAFVHSLCLADDSDPIMVRLSTESSLQPLFLAPVVNDGASYDDAYLRQLEKVLAFDLNQNGMTYVVKQTADGNRIASSALPGSVGQPGEWKRQQVAYVIKASVKGNTISALMLDVNTQSLKSTNELPLTGTLSQDRRQVHKVADTIHKALFGVEGIASTHLIYTMKAPAAGVSKKWVSEVWESDYDGANARQVTRGDNYCVTPTYLPPKPGFAPGGIAYVSYSIGQPKIYIASLKDGVGKRLSYLKANQLMPAFSPQRDKVAFISDITGNPDLFLLPFSPEEGPLDKPRQIYSARQATQGTPTFSPDGQRIAFVSDKDGSAKVYIIDIPEAGTSLKDIKATLITKRNRENSAPSWSPDGKKIAYCAKTQGERQIWVYDIATKEERQLTQGVGNKENPSWAPDSLHLVFNSSIGDASELYIMNLNQSETTQISQGNVETRFPVWEPRGR